MLYRLPPTRANELTTQKFMSEFADFLDSKIESSGKLIIGGDFNFHWDNPNNPDTKRINDIINSAKFTQHVTGVTHSHGHTIDWILSRECDDIVKCADIAAVISDTDHYMIHATINLSKPPLP